MRNRPVTPLFFAVLGSGLVVALWLFSRFGGAGESLNTAVSDFGGVIVISLCALAVIRSAFQLGAGPLRTQWLFIGAGVASFAMGDLVWAYIEVIRGAEVPYPGLPDAFYLLQYALLGLGIMLAGVAYRGLFDIRRPALVAAASSVALSVGLWLLFLGTLWSHTESALGERILNVAYPLADMLLLAGPALFVLLITRRLQGGRLGRPWIALCGGALLLAVTDTAYSFLAAENAYEAGMLVDYGWMIAFVLIATGALIVLQLALPQQKPAEKPEQLQQSA